MKKGGILVFGWNDNEDTKPVPLKQIRALKKFNPYYFKPLGGTAFKATANNHVYNFYIKP